MELVRANILPPLVLYIHTTSRKYIAATEAKCSPLFEIPFTTVKIVVGLPDSEQRASCGFPSSGLEA